MPLLKTSIELLSYSTMTSAERNTFLSTLRTQGMKELTLRIPAYSDAGDGVLSSTWETATLNMITSAQAYGININVDLHTWHSSSSYTMVWNDTGDGSDGFNDDNTNHEANRATFLSYIADAVPKLDTDGVSSFMVLNEPGEYSTSTPATSDENNFILDCISTAKALTDKPVSVRFMCGYSPSSGVFSTAIDSAVDFLCRNVYFDVRDLTDGKYTGITYPSTWPYGTTNAKLEAVYAAGLSLNKQVWLTEIGYPRSYGTDEIQRAFVEAWVAYAKTKNIHKIFGWGAQPEAAGEDYDYFNLYTPRDAFYELTNATYTKSPVSMGDVGLGTAYPKY